MIEEGPGPADPDGHWSTSAPLRLVLRGVVDPELNESSDSSDSEATKDVPTLLWTSAGEGAEIVLANELPLGMTNSG